MTPTIYTVLDLETTGLDHHLEGILEIAAVRLEAGVETACFHTLTRPDEEISAASQAIHGITAEMVAAAPAPGEVLDALLAFLGDSTLVAHNASFDIQFLDTALALAGKPGLTNPVIDTLELAREVFPNERSLKLESLCRLLGHPAVGFHRALEDARHLARVFPSLLARFHEKEAWYLEQFGRIEQVGERYELLTRLVEGLQVELGEQRRVLTRYFQAHPEAQVPLATGDALAWQVKDQWDYDLEALRPLLASWEPGDRLLKLDRARLERWLLSGRLTPKQVEAIATTRQRVGHTRRIIRVSSATGARPGDVLE